jgi:hypothetical protein
MKKVEAEMEEFIIHATNYHARQLRRSMNGMNKRADILASE